MPPLRILFLSDGRPGHFHLAEGIVAAVARLRPVGVERVEVRRPAWMPGRILSTLLNAGVPPGMILARIYGVAGDSLPASDLVVSAGGDTLAANICAARILGVPNIFYGSLRRFAPEDFALVLTSYARNSARPNSAMTLKPSRLDPDTLGAVAPLAGGGAPAVIGLLLGGDAGGFTYAGQDWDRLITLMVDLYRLHGTRWIVSNSRRTDQQVSDRIARLATQSGGPIVEFIDVRYAGSGTLASLFTRSDALVVTADSSSMVSEAVWTRRPVVTLAPARAQFTSDEQSYRTYLEQEGWCRPVTLAQADPQRLLQVLASVRPLAINPLDHLAALLRQRLPQLFEAPTRT